MYKIGAPLFLVFFTSILLGCTKATIDFVDNTNTGDPDIVYIDTFKVQLATYKTDSFATSGHEVFMIGRHHDSLFGELEANSYAQVLLPESNPVQDKTVLFDSLIMIMKPSGNYYGDTLNPITIRIHQLSEKIKNEDESETIFFNPRKFAYRQQLLGSTTVQIRPGRSTEIKIRLSDTLGRELLNKFRTNHADIQNADNFFNYFKGVYITGSNTNNNLFYFKGLDKNVILQLHYRLNANSSQKNTIDFAFNSSNQFNQIVHQPLSSPLSAFSTYKKQLRESKITANKAFLHSNIGTLIKISFPSVLTVKDLHPYVKILKAELVIRPQSDSYRYPYKIPEQLNLYTTNDNNDLISTLKDAGGEDNLTGNLVNDRLFPEKTQYTFDITQYINALLAEGRFSKSALMLSPASLYSDQETQRLIVSDQTIDKTIQLKLYVLGL